MPTQTSVEIELEDLEQITVLPNKDSGHERLSTSSSGKVLGPAPIEEPTVARSDPSSTETPKLSTFDAWVMIIQLCGNNLIASFVQGVLMVALPTMAADLSLAANLLLWPTAVGSLTSAACQLIAGSVSDTLGPRRFNTIGSLLQSIFIIATGFSQTGTQLIVFRALSGIATSIFSTSARGMLSTNIKHGRLRNFAFSSFVLAFPLGAGVGLVLGGVYADESTWRVGYWSSGAIGLVLCLSSIWTLPPNPPKDYAFKTIYQRLSTEIDWVGNVLGSTSVGLLSYVLASLSANTDHIHEPLTIALLTISLALIPAFGVWMHMREKRQLPALIPNSLWKDHAFTTVCIMIALSNATQTCLTYFVSFFFQEIQHLSPLQASIRLLPQAVTGCLMCLFVGLFVNKVTPLISILSTMAICSLSPLLMAITNPEWPYWYTAFWAQVFGPVAIDVMFVVGFLVVSDAFSGKAQARASAVFSTFASIGASTGLCIMSVISNSVIAENGQRTSTDALLAGYRASFWTQFAWVLAACAIGAVGLRRLAKVGMKRD